MLGRRNLRARLCEVAACEYNVLMDECGYDTLYKRAAHYAKMSVKQFSAHCFLCDTKLFYIAYCFLLVMAAVSIILNVFELHILRRDKIASPFYWSSQTCRFLDYYCLRYIRMGTLILLIGTHLLLLCGIVFVEPFFFTPWIYAFGCSNLFQLFYKLYRFFVHADHAALRDILGLFLPYAIWVTAYLVKCAYESKIEDSEMGDLFLVSKFLNLFKLM